MPANTCDLDDCFLSMVESDSRSSKLTSDTICVYSEASNLPMSVEILQREHIVYQGRNAQPIVRTNLSLLQSCCIEACRNSKDAKDRENAGNGGKSIAPVLV